MLQTCLEFVVPLAEFPNLRPLESDAGWLPHGYPQDRVWDPSVLCIPARTHAGRVLPNPPLSQWPPAPSSRGIPPPLAAVAVCDLLYCRTDSRLGASVAPCPSIRPMYA